MAINCKKTLNCINLFDVFFDPPLNKLAIPKARTIPTASRRKIDTILIKVPDSII